MPLQGTRLQFLLVPVLLCGLAGCATIPAPDLLAARCSLDPRTWSVTPPPSNAEQWVSATGVASRVLAGTGPAWFTSPSGELMLCKPAPPRRFIRSLSRAGCFSERWRFNAQDLQRSATDPGYEYTYEYSFTICN